MRQQRLARLLAAFFVAQLVFSVVVNGDVFGPTTPAVDRNVGGSGGGYGVATSSASDSDGGATRRLVDFFHAFKRTSFAAERPAKTSSKASTRVLKTKKAAAATLVAASTSSSAFNTAAVHRGDDGAVRLQRIFGAIASGEKRKLVVAVIGGSIAYGSLLSPKKKREQLAFTGQVEAYLRRFFSAAARDGRTPHAADVVVDARNYSEGATTSQYGVFCGDIRGDEDIVFVEYAVNDFSLWGKTVYYEALVRRLLTLPQRPLVVLLFFPRSHENDAAALHLLSKSSSSSTSSRSLLQQELSANVSADRQMAVGRHYDAPLVDVAAVVEPLFAADTDVLSAFFLRDFLHPTKQGHRVAALLCVSTLDALLRASVSPPTTAAAIVVPAVSEPQVALYARTSCLSALPTATTTLAAVRARSSADWTAQPVAVLSATGGFINESRTKQQHGMSGFAAVPTVWRAARAGARLELAVDGRVAAAQLVALVRRDMTAARVSIVSSASAAATAGARARDVVVDARVETLAWTRGRGQNLPFELPTLVDEDDDMGDSSSGDEGFTRVVIETLGNDDDADDTAGFFDVVTLLLGRRA
jgi:hypothetical protein